jgi:hypothetical protein
MPEFLYQTEDGGEESKTAERQKESVRGRALPEERDSVSNKIDR